MRMNIFRGARLVAMLSACLLACLGCASSKPKGLGSGSLAAVQIEGATSMQIARAVSDVFQEAGFVPVPVKESRGEIQMVFEREGSAMDAAVYGDWSFKKLWYRARVKIQLASAETHLVTCDAFRVYERGDKHFEEERRLSGLKRGGYQDLLAKARDRLNEPGE